jgi:hypothetical protein
MGFDQPVVPEGSYGEDKIQLGNVIFFWQGNGHIVIQSTCPTMFPSEADMTPDIWVDDALVVSNNNLLVEGNDAYLTAGTSERGPQFGPSDVDPEIPLDITSICQVGLNSLNFVILDYWGDRIGCSPLYVVLND